MTREPDELRVMSCRPVSPTLFHARRSSTGKLYTYRIVSEAGCSSAAGVEGAAAISPVHPLEARAAWVLNKRLNVEAMAEAAAALVGVRDWSFVVPRGAEGQAWERAQRRSPVRRVDELSVRAIPLEEERRRRRRSGGRGLLLQHAAGPPGARPASTRAAAVAHRPTTTAVVVEIRIKGDFFLWNQCRRIVGLLVEVGRGRCSVDDVRADVASCRLVTAPAKGLCLEEVYYDTRGRGVDVAAVAQGVVGKAAVEEGSAADEGKAGSTSD